jgi:hypothetical protein
LPRAWWPIPTCDNATDATMTNDSSKRIRSFIPILTLTPPLQASATRDGARTFERYNGEGKWEMKEFPGFAGEKLLKFKKASNRVIRGNFSRVSACPASLTELH